MVSFSILLHSGKNSRNKLKKMSLEGHPAKDAKDHAEQILARRKDAGVNNIEVYAAQYSHFAYRVALFFSLFLVAYAYGLDGMVRSSLQAYATSSYGSHSLLATINCVKAVIAAAGQICFARASDIFGRMTILVLAVVLYAVGTIIDSQATNITRYAAGACIYQLGYTGIILILEIIAMDFSNLNWRLMASFVPALPFIINTWISGNVLEALGMNWKWGIGMWAFIVPLSCVPLFACILHMRFLAHKNAKDQLESEVLLYKHMPWSQYLVEVFFWRLDLLGLLLVCVVFGCILVPFTLAGSLQSKWKQAEIIVPEVIGWCVALPLFLLWEGKYSRHPLVPWSLVKDRGIWSALIIAIHINFVWYMQGDYMYTVLMVAVNETAKSAARITSLYSFVSVITGFLLGGVIVYARRTKKFILFGIACWFVAFGLLVHYRGDSSSHSGIVGSLCLLGFGAGFFTYTTQTSIQASTKSHQDMAVITALYLSHYNIGSALGASISGAIWTNILPRELRKRITDVATYTLAYGSPFVFIEEYLWGTPERMEVVAAYRVVQRILSIVGLCFCVTLLLSAFFLRDHRLENAVALEDVDEKSSRNSDELETRIEDNTETKGFERYGI